MLIGCSRYSELPALPAVSVGLADLRAALTDPAMGGFAATACQVIADITDAGLLARALLEAARATQDTLLVYYSGHGVLDDGNNLHLALAGTSNDQALVPETALPFDRVRAILRASPARNRVVILDCCYAGRAIHDMSSPDLAERAVITGSYVLTATGADKTARAPDGARHTAFTGALLDLLRHGIPGGPDLLTLETLYPHLHQALVGHALPPPQQQGTGTAAGLALTRNPARSSTTRHIPTLGVPARQLLRSRTHVILTVAAAFLVAVGSAMLIPGEFEQKSNSPKPSSSWSAATRPAVASVASPGTSPCGQAADPHHPAVPGLTWTSPCPLVMLANSATVQGTARLESGESLWLFLFAPGDKKYYLMNRNDPIQPQSDHTWKIVIAPNNPDHAVAAYTLYAAIITADYYKQLIDIANNSLHPYLDELPPDTRSIQLPVNCCSSG